MSDRNLVSVIYTDDTGVQWITSVDNALWSQTTGDPAVPIIGGARYAGEALQELPRNLIRRGVYVDRSGQKRRFVPCLSTDAPLYTGAVTSVNLQQLGGAAAAYTRSRAKRETDHRKFRTVNG